MDREKVIKRAERIMCSTVDRDTIDSFCEDVIALLKEQEGKTGAWQWKIHGKPESGGTLGEAVCDQCGKSTFATAVKGNLNYCPNCGANMMNRR